VFRLDLHTHTRFFHGFPSRPTPFDPVGARLLERVAARQGLDGVALTNHDYYPDVPFDDLVAIPGIEVSTADGHVLIVGPDPPAPTNPGAMAAETVVEVAHDRDCAAIIAHPFRNSTVRGVDAPFDAVEVNGKHPRSREWVEHLARDRSLPIVGGSDAHYPVEAGRAYTVVDADEATPAAVVDAIQDGRVEARISNWPPHQQLRRVYRRIHRWKGHLDTPAWLEDATDEISGSTEPESERSAVPPEEQT
jgi:predicted metal-dependent phosphoesterase TrpH